MDNTKDYWFSYGNSCVVVKEIRKSEGKVLVFLHGRYGYGDLWNPLLESFSQQYRCLILDFPGFGRSYTLTDKPFSLLEHASFLDSIVERFTQLHEKVILVGHDSGGGIAQISALKSPQKVAALILMNTAMITRRLEKIPIGLGGWMARWKLKRLLNSAENMKAEDKNRLIHHWKHRSQRSSLCQSLQALDDTWPLHYERQVWKKEIQNLNLPVLLLWGKQDSLNLPEFGLDMAHRMPEAYFYMNENSSHWPHLDQPEWVSLKMKEFIFKTGYGATIMPAQKSLSR